MYVSCLSHFLVLVFKSSLGYRSVLVYASTKNASYPVINLVLLCTIPSDEHDCTDFVCLVFIRYRTKPDVQYRYT